MTDNALFRFGMYVLGFALLFTGWELAAVLHPSILFPPPLHVVATTIELFRDGELPTAIGASLRRIVIGFAGGCAIGIPIGLLMGSFRPMRYLIEPFTEFLRFIPATALITVAVIWFGIGEGAKIFLIIYSSVFMVVLNTAAGVGAIAPDKIRAARSLGANAAQIFLHVALPATVPYILTGMRLAMGHSFATIVAAELIAAEVGLGKMIWDARLYMLVDQIFVVLLVLGLLGFCADRLFRWGIRAFAGRFQPMI